MAAFIKAPFTLLEEQVEALPGNPVEPAQMALCLVPEVLNSIDVVVFVGKALRMVDPDMMEAGDIQGDVDGEAIRVDDAVGLDHAFHDRHQRGLPGVGNHHRVYPAGALQQPENRHFPGGSTTSFPFTDSTEIALVHFNLARKRRGFFHLIGN